MSKPTGQSADRRMIAPMMVEFFPTMADTEEHKFTSEEWHAFLNAKTGIDVPLHVPNTSAFDAWRIALAAQNFPVWNYTAEQVAAIKQRGEELKAKEDARVAALPARLTLLATVAPTKTAQQLIDDTKKAAKQ